MLRFDTAVKKEDFHKARLVMQEMRPGMSDPQWQGMESQLRTARRASVDRAATASIESAGSAALPQVQALYGRHADLFTPEEISQRTEMQTRSGVFTDLKKLAQSDPEGAELLAAERERKAVLTPLQRMEVQGLAQGQRQAMRRTQYETLHSALVGGELPPAEMAGTIAAAARLTPQDRAELASFAMEGPTNDVMRFSELNREAAHFSGVADSPEHSLLQARAGTLQEPLKKHVNDQLQRTLSSKDPVMTRTMGKVLDLVDRHLKDGTYGETTSRLGDPAAGFPPQVRAEIDFIKSEMREPDEMSARAMWYARQPKEKQRWSNYKEFPVRDPSKAEAALAKYLEVTSDLSRWLEKNPQAQPKDLFEYYGQQTGPMRAARNVTLPP